MSGYSLAGKRVWVSGHRGLVGSAIVRTLEQRGIHDILTASSAELDLRDQPAVRHWVADAKPQAVFLIAAKVGGILANDNFPADFLYDNLMIEANVIHAAHLAGVEKLLFLASSCIYPRETAQPIQEEALLSGPLEPTNQWYATAKIAGIKMCQAYRRQHGNDFISALPANLYGPNDSFDLQNGHVLPSLLRKFHEAIESGSPAVTLWGTGTARREFLHVDDLAAALVFLMEHYSGHSHINVGAGHDIEIRELAAVIQQVTGFTGRIVYDPTKPDGAMRKLMDTTRLKTLGWEPSIPLQDGVAVLYQWLVANWATLRGRIAA
ncbi:MAG TPA: GDP-L-fucose synthase [Acetobacteraceae bacterium]|jgi:GDP-L-fucose synthase|nr:GDP-L-fucose synthase [Acetobacteraceae bacterium]